MLVLYNIFKEEYNYIRPFVVIGNSNLTSYTRFFCRWVGLMSLPLKDKTWWKQQWQGRFENVNNWYQRVFIIFIIDQCHQRNFFYIHVYPCLAGPVLIGGGFMTIGFSVEATQSPITHHHLRSSCSEEKFQKYARLLHIFFFLRITLFV